MFFDKLWVRIKGELLTFGEDFPGAQEIKEKGEQLLQRLERQWEEFRKGKDTSGSAHEHAPDSEAETREASSLKDIEREWEQLLKVRDKGKKESEDSESTPPNPRTLG